ncbi:MAG: hypothetical protein ACPGJS_24255, partial [Flammeovirgaceae bacterium]
MSMIRTEFLEWQKRLHNHPFFGRLDSLVVSGTVQEAFAFIPYMEHFVYTFKDMLMEMSVKDSDDALQKAVNHHAEEDSEHWVWYIQDINLLEIEGAVKMLSRMELWGEECAVGRELAAEMLFICKNLRNPYQKMLYIDCMEATYHVFLAHFPKVAKHFGYHDRLGYFGDQHAEDEMGHTHIPWHHLPASKYAELERNLSKKYDLAPTETLRFVRKTFQLFDEMWYFWLEKVDESIDAHR